MLLFPVIVGLQCLFTLGVSFVIATLAAFYHDVRHLVEVGIGILFWLTPILYDIVVLPPGVREWILLNPITSFIVPYQQLFYHREPPDPYILVSAAAFAGASVAFGYSMFVAAERRLMEQL
jgi:lipopolysaccharide transport system permease protein